MSDATALEGSAGKSKLVFTVQLSRLATRATVTYSTANGTATAPRDYAAASGTLTFDRRHRKRTIAVRVVGDTVR
ncbi:MAG: hypothetical protein H0U00_07770 [Actinobacteria bacterium]|nr:hypothetical protein [Actinomycetota bacterium]